MPITSKCPKCQQPVAIPDGVEPEAEVRCPLCAVVYPLHEAIAEIPPALIPVESHTVTGAAPDSDSAPKSNLISEPFHTAESTDTAESPDAEQDVEESPQTDGAAADGVTPKIDIGQTPVDREVFAGFRLQEDEASQGETSDATPSQQGRRKRKREKSAAKEIVGAILGGFLGLAIGYYTLNYLGGERFDFMNIYLPGVPHTEQHRDSKDKDQVLCPTTTNQNLTPLVLTKRTPASPRL